MSKFLIQTFLPVLIVANFSIGAFAAEVQIHDGTGNAGEIPKKKDYDYVPAHYPTINPVERDKFYNTVELSPFIKTMDEVEKNTLYIRLRRLPLKRVTHLYPAIPADKLTTAYNKLPHSNE